MRKFFGLVGAFATALVVSQASAQSVTIATFSDPAEDASTPLFELDGSTFTGSWDGTGLDLYTPYIAGMYPDATFEMTPLTYDGAFGLSGGTIEFFDSGASLVFQIDFLSATLVQPFVFGASEFRAQDVTFSGPAAGPMPLTLEQFSFAFANTVITPTGATWTSAFTSSAQVIPEPASLMLLIGGTAVMAARRRLA